MFNLIPYKVKNSLTICHYKVITHHNQYLHNVYSYFFCIILFSLDFLNTNFQNILNHTIIISLIINHYAKYLPYFINIAICLMMLQIKFKYFVI